jgi:hypothetical protein
MVSNDERNRKEGSGLSTTNGNGATRRLRLALVLGGILVASGWNATPTITIGKTETERSVASVEERRPVAPPRADVEKKPTLPAAGEVSIQMPDIQPVNRDGASFLLVSGKIVENTTIPHALPGNLVVRVFSADNVLVQETKHPSPASVTRPGEPIQFSYTVARPKNAAGADVGFSE